MTVPQDTVLCAGLGLLPALLSPARPRLARVAWAAFAVGWIPVSAAFLLGWPSWSFFYPPGTLGAALSSPPVALGVGLGVETAAFAAALRWSQRADGPMLRRAMLGLLLLYAALLVLPAGRWLQVGTGAEFAAGTAHPLWEDGALLATLAVGGLWLVAVQGIALRRLRAAPLLAAALLVGCGGGGQTITTIAPPAPAALVVAPDAYRLVDALARAQEPDPAARLRLNELGEGAAYVELIRGRTHAAVVLREPSSAERRAAAGEGLLPRDPMLQRALARDTVVLAVPDALGVSVVSFDDAVKLLTGQQATWAPLGGSGAVRVLAPPRTDSARALAVTDLLGGEALGADTVELEHAKAVVEAVRRTPGAVGLTSLSEVAGVVPLSLRTPDGAVLEPRTATRTGEWPLVRSVVVVTQGTPHPQVDALIAFSQTERGREVIAEVGLWPPVKGR